MITKSEAILSLNPKSEFVLTDDELKWLSPNIDKPSDDQINTELKRLQAEYNANQYQRDRLAEYPDLQECIHAILDDDLTALQAKRKLVKEKYPKPE